jgi:single-stranded-DNA-specific exonuclease
MIRGIAKQIGKGNVHLSLNISSPNFTNPIKGIAFKHGDKYERVKTGKPFEAIFSISEEEFNGQINAQLNFRDLR